MSTNTSGMRSGVTLAALGATLLLALTTITVGIWGGMQHQALQGLRTEYAALEQRLVSLEGDMDQMAAQPAPVLPQPPLSQMPPPLPAPDMGSTSAPGGVPGMPPPPPTEGDGQDNPMGATIELLEDDPGAGVNHIDAQIVFHYGDFLDQYGLTPEKRAQVEGILRANMEEQTRVQTWAKADPSTRTQAMRDIYRTLAQSMRDQLSQVFTPRELADWDHYQDTSGERKTSMGFETALTMMSSSMSREGRDLAVDVLTEETLAAFNPELEATLEAADLTTATAISVAAQCEAVRIARERLSTALTPGDMQAFDRFADTMRAQ